METKTTGDGNPSQSTPKQVALSREERTKLEAKRKEDWNKWLKFLTDQRLEFEQAAAVVKTMPEKGRLTWMNANHMRLAKTLNRRQLKKIGALVMAGYTRRELRGMGWRVKPKVLRLRAAKC